MEAVNTDIPANKMQVLEYYKNRLDEFDETVTNFRKTRISLNKS